MIGEVNKMVFEFVNNTAGRVLVTDIEGKKVSLLPGEEALVPEGVYPAGSVTMVSSDDKSKGSKKKDVKGD